MHINTDVAVAVVAVAGVFRLFNLAWILMKWARDWAFNGLNWYMRELHRDSKDSDVKISFYRAPLVTRLILRSAIKTAVRRRSSQLPNAHKKIWTAWSRTETRVKLRVGKISLPAVKAGAPVVLVSASVMFLFAPWFEIGAGFSTGSIVLAIVGDLSYALLALSEMSRNDDSDDETKRRRKRRKTKFSTTVNWLPSGRLKVLPVPS